MTLRTPVINQDNVYIGILPSTELQRLHKRFNDGIFFENVRDFQGVAKGTERERIGRTTPNDEIVKTIQDEPHKMLERNNGIVFRADTVKVDTDGRKLSLTRGSIINGCQTTMCLIQYATDDHRSDVLVKIIEKPANDSWDVARAANYQNPVSEIDLLLAPSLRPQLAKRAASLSAVQLQNGEKSAFQIVDEIYDRTVVYEETRLLFIGVFSRSPNNVFSSNYTELMQDLIDRFYKDDPHGTKTFETLYELQSASQEGIEQAKSIFADELLGTMFDRYYKASTWPYRCFVSILASCSALKFDITKHQADPISEYERMKEFFTNALVLLQTRRERFLRFYILALKAWMQEVMPSDADEVEIQRDMNRLSKNANFSTLLRKLAMEAAIDDRLKQEQQEFEARQKL